MSMISGLIDELNKSADEWNGSNMFELARMCSDAADTIWQLRDDLQRANAENAKLRKEFDKMDKWHSAELTAAMDENAKLRELVRDLYEQLLNAYDPKELDEFIDRMRELGIEVDG